MIKTYSIHLIASIILSLSSYTCIAADKDPVSPVKSLSPELRELLSQEMLAIQEGMMAIIPAFSSGNNEEIASIAGQLENSFILKQNITEKQKKELYKKMPEEFIELDKQFHYNAGQLQKVAENDQEELIGFYFTQLSEACAGCHKQYALHQFPHLRDD